MLSMICTHIKTSITRIKIGVTSFKGKSMFERIVIEIPAIHPKRGPKYGIILMIPAKNPIAIAFLISSIAKEIETRAVMVAT